MSLVSFVNNNTCLISPVKSTQIGARENSELSKPKPTGVITKISNGKPSDPGTYTMPAQRKVSVRDVAAGVISSTAGSLVGASLGQYVASQYGDNTRGSRMVAGVIGGAMGAAYTPGNVFDALDIRSDVAFINSACAFVIGALTLYRNPIPGQNLNLIPNGGIVPAGVAAA